MPRLQILNGKRQGATFDVGRGGAVVGHRNTAPISIDDPWVSWDHARIFFQNDAFWIEDLGSTNGTFVNCVRVKRERLQHEDIVFFGKTHVIFLLQDATTGDENGGATGAGSFDKKRSSFEINVEQLAAAAQQWTAPTALTTPAPGTGTGIGWNAPKNGRTNKPTGVDDSTGPAIPVAPEERADPLNLAGLAPDVGGEPGEESSRGRHDPFRPGADPWEKKPPQRKSTLAALDPDADPFSSARAAPSAPEKVEDPFTAANPFDEKRARSAFETQHDAREAIAQPRPTTEDRSSRRPRPGDLGEFQIDDDENVQVTPVSAAELSSLLDQDRKKSGEGEEPLDDLDALLGDNKARTPEPGQLSSAPRPRKPSEALTRPVNTANAANLLGEGFTPSRTGLDIGAPGPGRGGSSRFGMAAPLPSPPPAMPATPATSLPRSQTGRLPPTTEVPASGARTQPLQAQGGPAWDEARPVSTGELAFELAKLQDEVRRVRMALDASRQSDPEKVRVAVEGLRDQELGRQAREIAELRRDLALIKEEHQKKTAELDDVTADMIAKEDLIESLKARVVALEKGTSGKVAADRA